MKEADSSELFNNKGALLDINILSNLAKEDRAEKFRPVFEFLKEHDADIFTIDATYFELVGFSGNNTDHKFLHEWIDSNFPIHPSKIEDVERATRLTSIYKQIDPNLNTKQISYCDALYAAQLIKYKGRAFLVTTDIHDYPISIFDIAKLMVVEDNKKAVVVAFIVFNEEKWKKALENFEKSGRKIKK